MKVQQLNMPTEWQPLIEKIFRWYDNQRYPCWGMRWIGGSRAAKARSKANSITQQIADAWAGVPDKTGWEAAGVVYESTAYKLFTKDQSWRIKNGVAGVATPSTLHQYTVRQIQVSENTGQNNVCVYRRRHISSLPVKVSLSIKVDRSSAVGQVAVVVLIVNKVRGNQWPTFYRLATIEGDQDWMEYAGTIHRYIVDRVSSVGIVIGFENGWEGSVLLDNTRIIEDDIDEYVGWRQNPGTDDWREIPDQATIIQNIIYPE